MSDFPLSPASLAREAQIRLIRILSLPLAAALLFFFVTPSGVPPFQPSQAQVRRQVVNVIEGQFEAFKEGDYARARSFAATALQAQFNVAAFERMVKEGYPVIAFWRALSVEAVHDNGREAVVEVITVPSSGLLSSLKPGRSWVVCRRSWRSLRRRRSHCGLRWRFILRIRTCY